MGVGGGGREWGREGVVHQKSRCCRKIHNLLRLDSLKVNARNFTTPCVCFLLFLSVGVIKVQLFRFIHRQDVAAEELQTRNKKPPKINKSLLFVIDYQSRVSVTAKVNITLISRFY